MQERPVVHILQWLRQLKKDWFFYFIFYPNLEPTGKHTGIQAQLNTAYDFAQKPRVNRPLSKEGDNAEPASSSQTSRAPYFPEKHRAR